MLVEFRTMFTPGMGALSFLEGGKSVPFEMRQVCYVYDNPEGFEWGKLANEAGKCLLICTYGAIEVSTNDGSGCDTVLLDDPATGLVVEGLTRPTVRWLRDDSVLMVATSGLSPSTRSVRGCSPHTGGTGHLIVVREAMGGFAIEGGRDVPFDIKRIYYTYDVPEGTVRGGHAHRALSQLLVCTHGEIEILLDDCKERETVTLDDPSKGLLVGPMVWHDMRWVQGGSVLTVLASDYYEESDYIRDYGVFESEAAAFYEEV